MKKQKEYMVMDDRNIRDLDELPPIPKEIMLKARKAARTILQDKSSKQ